MTASARLSQNLRVTPEDQDLIDRAVNASGITRTDFGLQPARLAVQELLIPSSAGIASSCGSDVANLLVRGLDEAVVKAMTTTTSATPESTVNKALL